MRDSITTTTIIIIIIRALRRGIFALLRGDLNAVWSHRSTHRIIALLRIPTSLISKRFHTKHPWHNSRTNTNSVYSPTCRLHHLIVPENVYKSTHWEIYASQHHQWCTIKLGHCSDCARSPANCEAKCGLASGAKRTDRRWGPPMAERGVLIANYHAVMREQSVASRFCFIGGYLGWCYRKWYFIHSVYEGILRV